MGSERYQVIMENIEQLIVTVMGLMRRYFLTMLIYIMRIKLLFTFQTIFLIRLTSTRYVIECLRLMSTIRLIANVPMVVEGI